MTVKLYKLTTQDNKTRAGEYNECVWGPGVTHRGTGRGGLCGPGYIHAYLSPALALLLNPIHANIANPRLWECSASNITLSDNDLKVGVTELTTLREIKTPEITTRHRVIFALLCVEKAQEVTAPFLTGDKAWQITYREQIDKFNEWKAKYLAGDKEVTWSRNATAYAARATADDADATADAARATADAADYSATPSDFNLVEVAERMLTYRG